MELEYFCKLYFQDDYGTFILNLIVELRQLNFDFWFSRKENNIYCFSFTDHNDAAQAELIAKLHCHLTVVEGGNK